ncbi:MAG: biopolymer transporter ExbD [Deltaproteobacteria bacterium]|nr:biopolymer transporter ExbD [Deltaproteobacteria bacterium]
MQFKEKTDSDAHLDITPIVDTVFNLLIFFALSLNFIVTPGIKVNLPESSTEEIVREKEEIVIVIKQGNEIFINNSSVSIEQLFLILSESAQRNRETLIIIQADQGLTRLAIATIVMKKTIAKGR